MTGDDLDDLSDERPSPDLAAGAVKVAGCRCDPRGNATYVDEDDGTRRCFGCAKRREPS